LRHVATDVTPRIQGQDLVGSFYAYEIRGRAADDVYAATSVGTYRYDGQRWLLIDRDLRFDLAIDQNRLVSRSANQILTLDSWGDISGNMPQLWTKLTDVDTAGRLWGASVSGSVSVFDGLLWQDRSPAVPPAGVTDLTVLGSDEIVLVATGQGHLHVSGNSWRSMQLPSEAVQVWGNSTQSMFVKAGTAIYSGSEGDWNLEDVQFGDSNPNRVWSDGEVVFICHDGGLHQRVGDNQWILHDDLLTFGCLDVWATGPDNVYVTRALESVVQFDGVSWTALDDITAPQSTGITGTGPDDVFITFAGGANHFDGVRWTPVSIDTVGNFALASPRFLVFGFANSMPLLLSRFAPP
jgi:hypothetical protein